MGGRPADNLSVVIGRLCGFPVEDCLLQFSVDLRGIGDRKHQEGCREDRADVQFQFASHVLSLTQTYKNRRRVSAKSITDAANRWFDMRFSLDLACPPWFRSVAR